MSIFLNANSKVIVQGITGGEGTKHTARAAARSAGVPVFPGTELLDSATAATAAAAEIGYPVMLKATGGGGGIGMQVCRDAAELRAAYDRVVRLAERSFGAAGVFLERFVEHARHVEVQVFGDGTGRVVSLGDRDCSLQRRHQKVIEEAPAPLLTGLAHGAELRERLGKAAVDAAVSVGYRGAGTVEFLVSDENPDEFFFMEMNTRLQVEHPVSEEVVRVRGEHVDHLDQRRPCRRAGAVPDADQGRYYGAVDGADECGHQVLAHRAAGPLDHLHHGVGALLHHAALDVAQPGMARARHVPLVARDEFLGVRAAEPVADQQVDEDVGGRLGATPTPGQRGDAVRELLGLAAADVFDGLGDEVVERREVVRRRRQRQAGATRHGAVPDSVEAALTQQLGGSADQRLAPAEFGHRGDLRMATAGASGARGVRTRGSPVRSRRARCGRTCPTVRASRRAGSGRRPPTPSDRWATPSA